MRFRSAKHLRWYAGTALFFVVLHAIGVLGSTERVVRSFMDPVVHSVYTVFQKISGSHFFSKSVHTEEEYGAFLRERDILKTRVALVEAENGTLRRELQYSARSQWQTIGAEVLAKTSDITEQALILNRGSDDGVKANQVVFTDQGVLVGSIIAAEKNRSYVRLVNDRQSRVGALHVINSKPIGIVEGGYGLGVRLTLIPSDEVVAVGDLIETNDVTEFMPRGLLIGRVANVGRETYEPFQHALIEPIIAFDQIKIVTIILSK